MDVALPPSSVHARRRALTRPTLILTRPEAQGRLFAAAVRRAGIGGAVLFSPVLAIEHRTPTTLPHGDLVVSSVHGVAAAGDVSGRHVWAVGPATARAARLAGALLRGTASDVAGLTDAIRAARPARVVHLHGTHVAGTLVADLRAGGVAAEGIVVYAQRSRELTPAARRALSGGPVLLPLFSPRSASLAAASLDGAPAAASVLAISAAAARAWKWPGSVTLAARPDAAAMLDGLRGLVAREGDR